MGYEDAPGYSGLRLPAFDVGRLETGVHRSPVRV